MISDLTSLPAGGTPSPQQDAALRDKAVQLESFLFEEMMRASGTSSPSAGGGDSQFESFLRRAHAEAVAGSGQTGLGEAIYHSLLKSQAG
ncbi:MAG: flagellar biosynthesis protein FlgJ [Pseudomonadota bacterium]